MVSLVSVRSLAAPIAWSIYLLWRAPEWGWFSGIPLTPFTTAMLSAVWWLWWIGRRPFPLVGFVVVLTVIKIALSPLLVERGFRASYFANDSWQGQPERGLYVRDGAFTQIDRRLQFGKPDTPELPVFFFNDAGRFNFYLPGQPRIAQLPYSAIWSGYLQVTDRDPEITIYLGGPGISGQADVDGFTVVRLEPADEGKAQRVRLRPGSRQMSIRFSGPYGAPRQVEAGLVDASGRHHPFDASNVTASRVAPWRLTLDRLAGAVAGLMDVAATLALAFIAFLAIGGLAREVPRNWRRILVAAGMLFAIGEAFWFVRGFHEKVILLGGGSDWLTYESYARDIVRHGPLMTLGRPGVGAPFYYQPLYPYFLALTHLLFGESLWGGLFVQRLFLSVTVYAIWTIGEVLFGTAVGIGTLLASIGFVWTEVEGLTRNFLSEILFIPLLCLWTASLCRIATGPPRRVPVASAVWGALATLTRSTLLLAWPLIVVPVLMSYRRARRSLRPLAMALMIACVIVGLATLRNWIVSGQLVPITSSFGINLYLGNPSPPGIPRNDPDVRRRLALVASDPRTIDALEFAVEAPRAFLEGLRRKAAYTLGWFDVLDPVNYPQPDNTLIATWAVALAGIVMMLWSAVRTRTVDPAGWIPFLIALSHFASMVLIFPQGYGARLILPFYVMLLPYAGLALTAVARRGARLRHPRLGRKSEPLLQ